MPHIHTQPGQHDYSATAYIVRVDTPEPRALLYMHRKLSMLLPPGGHVELHETPWQAMAHELHEESGYSLNAVKILQPPHVMTSMDQAVLHPYPLVMNTHQIGDDHFHSDICYGLVVESDPIESADEGESTDLRWLNLEELRALKETDIYPSTRQIYEFLLTEALENWNQVPTTQFIR